MDSDSPHGPALPGSPQPGPAPAASGHHRVLARNWPLVMLRGVLAIVVAVIAFLWPGAAVASLVLLFSAYMVVDGVFAVLSGVRAARRNERWGWFVLEGATDIAMAAIAFLWPGLTVLVFVWLVAVWALVSGVLMLVAAVRLSRTHGRGWLLLAGLVSLAWGLVLLAAPEAGAIAMTWWLGAYALAFGGAMVALGWQLRSERRRTLADEARGPLGVHQA